jgi:GNAT superfamily N-acetyltransferase
MAAEDNLSPHQFSAGGRNYIVTADDTAYRTVVAHAEGNKRPVGRLSWYKEGNDNLSNKVANVDVVPAHQRRGVATAMWEHAKKLNPDIQHSHARTPDGRAWSAKVGD